MTKNFFPTLGDALESVRAFLADSRAVLAEPDTAFDKLTFGGVAYGETKQVLALLTHYRGKEITGRMAARALNLSVYRMESGTYEAIAYVG